MWVDTAEWNWGSSTVILWNLDIDEVYIITK